MRRVWLSAIALVLAGCGGSPSGPSNAPPAVVPITLTPPADVRVDNVIGTSATVNYAQPVAAGGVPPITVSCAPASGSAFPLGTTTVQCTGTDGVRSGVCQFKVTVLAFVPVLSVNSFLAVGDSIAAGENGDERHADILCSSTTSAIHPQFIELCRSYPFVLQTVLQDRYTSQSISVISVGERGQTTGTGLSLLGGYLGSFRPDALLLLEGVNDLPGNSGAIVPNLRAMIQMAKGFGVKEVFLSTLLPTKPSCCGATNRFDPTTQSLIGPINSQIRALASQQGIVLADSGGAFLAQGNYDSLLENDGLHPSPAGYKVIADTFFAAIKTRFETSNAPAALARFR